MKALFKRFSNLKIFNKLMVGFLAFILLIGLTGYMAKWMTSKAEDRLSYAFTNYYMGIRHLGILTEQLKETHVLTSELASTQDTKKIGEFDKRLDASLAEIEDQSADLTKMPFKQQSEIDANKSYLDIHPQFIQIISKFRELYKANQFQAANSYFNNNVLDIMDKTEESADALTKAIDDNADKEFKISGVFSGGEMAVIISSFIILLAAVFMMFVYISRSISRPIKQFLTAMSEVEGGNLTVDLKINTKDEIGLLASSFNNMLSKVRQALISVTASAEMVTGTSGTLSSTTEELTDVSQKQAHIVEEFTSSIEQMDTGIQDTTSNISKLTANVTSVSSSVKEMGNSVQDTAKNIEEVSSAIKRVSESIEHMDDSIKTIVNHSKEAQNDAKNTVEKAKEGKVTVGNTVNEMDRISEAVSELSANIKNLGNSAEKIDEIIGVIDDIAEQTNLLSLNAAIEAARAGDAGKGFAVVANSIRGLAERSGEATKDIGRLIKGIQDEVRNAVKITNESAERVKEGVQQVKGTGQAFEDIYNAITETSSLIGNIAVAIEEEETGTREIVKSVEKINEIISQLSATAEEQSAGSDEVIKAVTDISELMQNISSTTEQQSAGSQGIVNLIQGINKGINDISQSSGGIKKSIQEMSQQAKELMAQVNKFKIG